MIAYRLVKEEFKGINMDILHGFMVFFHCQTGYLWYDIGIKL